MSDNVNNENISHIIIRGKPYERGLSYGKQVKNKIIESLNYYKAKYLILDWVKVQHFIQTNYMKALVKYYPSGLDEMRGIADGCGLTLEDIIVLNARNELMLWRREVIKKRKSESEVPPIPHECTSAVCMSKATQSGDVLMGQNWDQVKDKFDADIILLLEVYPDPSENIVPFIMITEVGQLGRIGMNANGFGITGMSLFSSEDHFQSESTSGYIPIGLLRRLFIESPNFPVGIKRLLNAPKHMSVNMTVATAEDVSINIEMTPNNHFISYPSLESHYMTHCNVFKSDAFFANNLVKDVYQTDSSWVRDRQMQKYFYTKCKFGTITTDSFTDAFKDHLGFPDSICGHIPPKGREDLSTTPHISTCANIIMNLTTKTLRLCKGNPCVGVYKEYSFENTIKLNGI